MRPMTPALRRLRLAAACLALGAAARAEVTLATPFTDHAVLQRDKLLPVWGRASAGERVTVTFKQQVRAATAGADGRWMVLLDALPADGAGAELVVAGKANTLTVRDVVVGEVWLCAGQSNMEFTVEARPGTWQRATRAQNAATEVAAANFPLIRQLKIKPTVADAPADTVETGGRFDDFPGGWQPASPQTVGGFTAVGYFFARDLFQKLGVPVGLVHASWGGTPVEAWLSPAALASDPKFKVVAERWDQTLAEHPAKQAAYEAQLAAWKKADADATAKGAKAHAAWLAKNPRPRPPLGPGSSWTPAGLFNGMINPLLPYALRGALWYQGESNTDRADEYRALFGAMITAWRAHFGQGDFPFYWVNLAAFRATYETAPDHWPRLREAQTQTLALPNTGQAIAIDLGDPDDIHPARKQEVGRRLALLARNRVYGIVCDDTGPTFAGATREGPALRVRFEHAGGLIAHDKPVQSLEVAGADKKFYPATGKIERDTLLVSAPQVKEPVAVRYAWKNYCEANLYNGAGLPAVPFRSDNW
jgi:sialate O-acetylesterase